MTTSSPKPVKFEDVSEALTYLAESAHDYAIWSGREKFLREMLKVTRAKLSRSVMHNTVTERENFAYSHADYKKALEDYEEATVNATLLEANRGAAEAYIEIWRTEEASRRAANIQ